MSVKFELLAQNEDQIGITVYDSAHYSPAESFSVTRLPDETNEAFVARARSSAKDFAALKDRVSARHAALQDLCREASKEPAPVEGGGGE